MLNSLQEKLKEMGAKNMMSNMQVKLKELGAENVMNTMKVKLKEIGAENMMNNMQVKLKELGAEDVKNTMKVKLKELGAENMMNNMQVKLKEMGAESMMNTMLEKFSESILYLQSFAESFITWLDQVFPPETRKEKLNHLLHVAQPFIIPGLAILVCLWFCSGGKAVKMMKAPGRNTRIARPTFESNPKSYFRNLHKEKPF